VSCFCHFPLSVCINGAFVVEEEDASPCCQPARKRRVSSAVSIPDTVEDSSDANAGGRPAAKKARSDTALGGPGPSRVKAPRPRLTQARAVPQVVLQARRAPATFDPMRDLQKLEEDVAAAFAAVRARWEGMAYANMAQAQGKGKGKAA
jgi:hypothetical protein